MQKKKENRNLLEHDESCYMCIAVVQKCATFIFLLLHTRIAMRLKFGILFSENEEDGQLVC